MAKQKQTAVYTKPYKYLHWVLALLIIAMLSFGFFMGDMPKAWKGTVYMLHKSTGLSILALIMLRLVLLWHHGKPKLPGYISVWERLLATSVQHALYVATIAMALSGWIMATASNKVPIFLGLFRVPCPFVPENEVLAAVMNTSHKTLAWILLGLVGLHICGALKHYFIDKDDILSRMIP